MGEGRATFGSLLGSKAFARGSVNVFVQGEHSPAVDLNGDGYSELARRRLLTAGARGEWRPGSGTTVMIDYQFTGERRRGGNLFDRPAHLANIAEQIDSDMHRGSISVTQVTCVAAADYARRSRMPWLLLPCDGERNRSVRRLGGKALPGVLVFDAAGRPTETSWRADGSSAPRRALARLLNSGRP